MNNRGKIVVFISMITAAMLVLITLVIQVVVLSAAKSKTVIASRLSMSDIKACYNSYIFEHYHILLFDKTAGGRGEAYLEEQLQQEFVDKLGSGYADTQVAITDMEMLTDNNCVAFKEQIKDYMVYAAAEQGIELGVDKIREKTGGQDGTLPEELKEDMKDAEDGVQKPEDVVGVDDTTEKETDVEPDVPERENMESDELQSWKQSEDPRDYTKKLSNSMILNLVLPEDKTVSMTTVELEDAPSRMLNRVFTYYEEIDRDFDNMQRMSDGLEALGSWQDSLVNTGAELVYAGQVFNSYQEEKNETAVLTYEQEYLIAGKASDYENLKSVANRMIGIRFPVNYISLCKQPDKMEKLKGLATAIAWAAPYLIPAVKYFLAGCWAYIESIADVRVLFDGKKAPFSKNADTWITDIEHIGESLSKKTEDDEDGLDYQAYLTILQALDAEGVTARMLDLIQINTRQSEQEFEIKNAAVGFSADFESSFNGQTFRYHQSTAY